jgi:predicted enzyme related to lactoylglutathione lyase
MIPGKFTRRQFPKEREQDMKPKAVDFFAFNATDIRKSIEFYRDTLGMKLLDEVEHEGKLIWAEFEVGATTIALHTPDYGPPQGAIALAVEDVDAAVNALKKQGIPIPFGPMDSGICRLATALDPDGNPIILHRRHDGTCG